MQPNRRTVQYLPETGLSLPGLTSTSTNTVVLYKKLVAHDITQGWWWLNDILTHYEFSYVQSFSPTVCHTSSGFILC